MTKEAPKQEAPKAAPPSMFAVTMYMAFNFFSSVSIIAVNKAVFRTFQYNFPTLLTGFHFVVTFLGLCVCNALGMFTIKEVPMMDALKLSLTFCGFVVFNNLSLQWNSVGFYQLMKVLTSPVIVVIQYVMFNVALHWKLKLALVPICVGVALATVSDIEVNFYGTLYAILGILSTSMYQIWVKSKQKDLGLNSYQLLFYQAPMSAVIVFVISFLTEPTYGPDGWMEYNYTLAASSCIIGSCVLAFCVNLSIFLVIGKSSPIAYNVLGHFKLCVVLFTGWMLFQEEMGGVKLFGTLLTFAGVVTYSTLQQNLDNGWDSKQKQAAAAPTTSQGPAAIEVVSRK